jgi:hypothetical protein
MIAHMAETVVCLSERTAGVFCKIQQAAAYPQTAMYGSGL